MILHISCKFSLDVFGEEVNTFIVLSSAFFDLERERSKISRASPVRCRMEIVFIFTKKYINRNKNQNKRTARGAGEGGSFITGRRENKEKALLSNFVEI